MEQRPNPDVLLAKVQREAARKRRGRLMIFFGAAAGVGKTFAMLEAARERRAEGEDVVAGVVETHGREETQALLEGLEMLPPREVDHRGTAIRELDLDAALKRRPTLILVDELAHSNAPGSRHAKRWQDVEELLDAGIDVYTTLNVQHLESVGDVVAGITGIRVFEAVPDTFFDQADEVELVDLPPDDLLERLREGKVYMPEAAERAIANFFRKGNLMALRELALRRTAERVDAQMRDYRDDYSIRSVWPAGEQILVCLSPGPRGERLVRAGRRLAASLRAPWLVAYIETPRLQRLPAADRDEVMETLRLAEQLGAETMARSGQTMSEEILEIVHSRNVTKVVMGQPSRRGWRRWVFGSVVDAVAGEGRDFDLFLIGGMEAAGDAAESAAARLARRPDLETTEGSDRKKRLDAYLWGAGVTLVCTAIAWLMRDGFALANLIMVYLVGVVFVAVRLGRGPSIMASILSVLAFDFFFVPPYLTFAVSDTEYIVTFAVMLLVGLVISSLTTGVRSQAKVAGYRERRAAALYDLSRTLVASRDEQEIVSIAVRRIAEEFQSPSVILLPDPQGRIRHPAGPPTDTALRRADLSVAQWVFDHNEVAGQGTDTLPGAEATYFPVNGPSATVGVLAIRAVNLRRIFLPEQQRLLETFLAQTAQAVERVRLAEKAKTVEVQVKAESLRNALLSAISHDLRTPLAAIVGAASSLVEDQGQLTPEERRELSRAVFDEAQRMASLASNILDMARLESGAVTLNRQWHPLEEIVGAVLRRLQPRLEGRAVTVNLPPDLPLVRLDGALIEQVMANLLENAAKYAPAGTPVDISARLVDGDSMLEVSVADRGPGIPPEELDRLFEKFYRARADRERAQSGVGLGLTICRAIITAHGGTIQARNRAGGRRIHLHAAARRSAARGRAGGRARCRRNGAVVSEPRPAIVCIEDDPQMRRFLRTGLGARGFRVFDAETGRQGLAEASRRKPDLVVLDLGLPDMDGVDVVRELRSWTRLPVIVLSARTQETDKIAALDAGADDYLTKPFGLGELLARIRVALRHAGAGRDSDPVYTAGPLQLDFEKRLVTVGDRPVHLTPNEYRLLCVLARNAGRVLTHRQLLQEVWGPGYAERSHYLRVYMAQLRHKLEADPARPRFLLTEPGVGYRFVTD